MESLTDRIIDRIQRNRISTAEVTDCLEKTGALPRVVALNRGHHRVGKVFWTYAHEAAIGICTSSCVRPRNEP